ncbi:MAG: hypothetical protein LBG43_00665 [Treponema sp.]|nr:hypothetical protein [Treponema sp.]
MFINTISLVTITASSYDAVSAYTDAWQVNAETASNINTGKDKYGTDHKPIIITGPWTITREAGVALSPEAVSPDLRSMVFNPLREYPGETPHLKMPPKLAGLLL